MVRPISPKCGTCGKANKIVAFGLCHGCYVEEHGTGRETRHFTREEAERMISAAENLTIKIAFTIGRNTGARSGEICKLRVDHLRDRFIQVPDSKKKNLRTIPLPEEVIHDIRLYLRERGIHQGLMFPGRDSTPEIETAVEQGTFNDWTKTTADRLGIVPLEGFRIVWHSWRKTFIVLNRRMGIDWLKGTTGDSRVVLEKYYTTLTPDDLLTLLDGGEL